VSDRRHRLARGFPANVPASEADLQRFETAFGELPADYRWFLSTLGSAAGLDDLAKLWHSQAKYEKAFGPPIGWSMERVLVIAWSATGDPIAIHKPTGRVLTETRGGDIRELAPSFLDYLEQLGTSDERQHG
jgi:hypothetical protein